MKNLIISVVCLLLLMVPWSVYHHYSRTSVDRYAAIIDQQVIPFAEMGDWNNAENSFMKIINDWNKYKNISAFFISSKEINETDCEIARVLYYIKSRDPYDSVAGAAGLKISFMELHDSETPSPSNLF